MLEKERLQLVQVSIFSFYKSRYRGVVLEKKKWGKTRRKKNMTAGKENRRGHDFRFVPTRSNGAPIARQNREMWKKKKKIIIKKKLPFFRIASNGFLCSFQVEKEEKKPEAFQVGRSYR